MHAISRRTTQPEKAGAVRQSSLHSQTPQYPHVSLNCLLRQGRHGHRLEEGALGYSIRKPQDYNCLLRFSPAFYRGTHHLKIGRKSSSSSQLHQWLGAPCSPAVWTLSSQGWGSSQVYTWTGCLCSTELAPPGVGMRGKTFLSIFSHRRSRSTGPT